MKQITAIIIALFFLVGGSGCSTVVSKHPMGAQDHALKSAELDGNWVAEDELLKIKVTDEAKGLFRIAWIEDKNDDLKLSVITCRVMEYRDSLYLTAVDVQEEELAGFYYWGKFKMEGDRLTFWAPSPEAFKEAVEQKKLVGEVKESKDSRSVDVRLTDDPVKILELVDADAGRYFDLESPITLIRFGKD